MNRKNLNGSFNIIVNGLPYNTVIGDKYYNETVALFNSNPELFEIEKEKEISIEELRYNKYSAHATKSQGINITGFAFLNHIGSAKII